MRQFFSFVAFHIIVLTVTVFWAMQAKAVEGADAKMLTVYSAQKEHLIRPVLEMFEEKTGIKVRLTTGKDSALIARLKQEGEQSPADLLLAADVGRLALAQREGLLQPVKSVAMEGIIPPPLRSAEGYWYGVTMRARVLFARKADMEANPELFEDLSYEALTGDAFAKGIVVRSAQNIYNQSLVASLIAHHGEEKAAEIVAGLVDNFARKPVGNDRDQLRALAAGVGNVAIANSYYFGLLLNSEDPKDRELAEKLTLIFPNQKETGTHANIRGGAVVKASRNAKEATQLLEFLVSKEAQAFFAEHNYEYPVNTDVEANALLQSWGAFKVDATPLATIGENNMAAVKVMKDAGWQ